MRGKPGGVRAAPDSIFIGKVQHVDVSGIPGASGKRSWPRLNPTLDGILNARLRLHFDPLGVLRREVGV